MLLNVILPKLRPNAQRELQRIITVLLHMIEYQDEIIAQQRSMLCRLRTRMHAIQQAQAPRNYPF